MSNIANADKLEMMRANLNWMIPDAQKRVLKAAEQMLWRAQRAVEDAQALVDGNPSSLSWITGAESDSRQAREAEVELNKLVHLQKYTNWLAE